MDLLMAYRAVLESGRAKVMKSRRHAAQCGCLCSKIGVALQTNEANLMPRQHARVSGAMRLMTGLAPLKPHGCVLKGERTPFICVALKAAGFVCRKRSYLTSIDRAVRVVTVDARHCTFG